MDWTEELVTDLRSLWSEGKSASVIAEKLSFAANLAVSRNAVIGKAHRLGLEARPSPIKGPMRPRIRKIAEAKTVMGLSDRMCKWPIGDPRQPDFHFCGGHAEGGLPYCAEHAAVAYQPARRNGNEEARLTASLR